MRKASANYSVGSGSDQSRVLRNRLDQMDQLLKGTIGELSARNDVLNRCQGQVDHLMDRVTSMENGGTPSESFIQYAENQLAMQNELDTLQKKLKNVKVDDKDEKKRESKTVKDLRKRLDVYEKEFHEFKTSQSDLMEKTLSEFCDKMEGSIEEKVKESSAVNEKKMEEWYAKFQDLLKSLVKKEASIKKNILPSSKSQ